ncbi:hypothetical protein RIF29_04700 [Crotalaria pallida]|uniref:Uncharacterized protein n=1 Tax=Crotalaria pallida TaxID=3830 RepID=A0AAN9J2B8_CROPI
MKVIFLILVSGKTENGIGNEDGEETYINGKKSKKLNSRLKLNLHIREKLFKETPLGIWEFRSKSGQDLSSLEGGCRGYMFALQVTKELEDWPEQNNRDRRWDIARAPNGSTQRTNGFGALIQVELTI